MRDGEANAFESGLSSSTDELESLIARLADEYLDRLERGESPDIKDYVARWPGDARVLRQAFASLELMRLSSVAAAADRALATVDSAHQLGEFRLLRELGSGGMGVVYEAEQLSLGRRVAIKILPFAGVLDPRQLQRFKNEALAAAQLNHPNIVDVIAVGCERGVHFYAMRLVEGPTLAHVVAELRKRPNTQDLHLESKIQNPKSTLPGLSTESPREHDRCAARLMADVALALDHAHQLGIVHRDIKPSNILLDARGKPWVTDFGLARLEAGGELTMTGDLLGTLRYMSPEQASGNRRLVDHRTDIYSLGAMLYELLTFEPAFAADDREKLLRRIAREPPRALRKLARSLPVELETIVLKALEKDPADRYATAGKVADDLERFLDHRPIRARRSRVAAHAKSLWRRHQVLLVAVLITLLLASSVAGVLVWRQWREAVEQRGLVIAREADLRQRVYAGDMRAAHQAWQRGDVARVRELLDRYAGPAGDDVRDFAWHYLSSLLAARPAPLTVLRPGHRNIYCVQFSPDGKLLAAACGDGSVQLWNVADWTPRPTLKAHRGDADCVAFSPDSKLLASGGEDGRLRLWNVETGDAVRSIDAHQKDTLTVAISPDGRTLAAGGIDGMVRFWRLPEGEPRGDYGASRGRLQHLAFSPDGGMLATAGGDASAMVLDVAANKPRSYLPSQGMAAYAVAFSPDGEQLAIGSGSGLVTLVDAATGDTEHQFGIRPAQVRAVAFSPTRPLLASAGLSGVVDLWDIPTRSLAAKLHGHGRRIWSLSFSPDGKLLASGGDDGSVHIWNPDAESGVIPAANDQPIYHLRFGPAGEVLTADDTQELVEWHGATLQRLKPRKLPDARTQELAYSPDRQRLAVRSPSGEVWLADAQGGGFARFDPGLKGPVAKIALAREGRFFAWYADGGLEVWNTDTKSLLDQRQLTGGPGSWPAATSTDGRLVAADSGGALVCYDVDALVPRFERKHESDFYGLGISADNRWLAAGAAGDGSVHFLDAITGETAFKLSGHQHWVDSIAFSPDGRTLATAGHGGAVRLWNLATREELFVVRRLDSNSRVLIDFSLDGRRLAAATSDRQSHGRLFVWSTSASP